MLAERPRCIIGCDDLVNIALSGSAAREQSRLTNLFHVIIPGGPVEGIAIL
jgi:hypothetical protein